MILRASHVVTRSSFIPATRREAAAHSGDMGRRTEHPLQEPPGTRLHVCPFAIKYYDVFHIYS